jgi:hypothetical protein
VRADAGLAPGVLQGFGVCGLLRFHVLAWSVALFLLHLALARAIDIPVGGYIYFTLLTVLEKLERSGFPQLTTGSDSGWPVPNQNSQIGVIQTGQGAKVTGATITFTTEEIATLQGALRKLQKQLKQLGD